MSFLSDMLAGKIKPPPPEAFHRGVKSLVTVPDNYDSTDSDSDEDCETESYRQQELEGYARSESRISGSIMGMTEVGTASNIDSEVIQSITVPEAFSQYNFNVNHRTELPIDAFKTQILNKISSSSVIVIHGPTGCGKTTQVPQFILDECKQKRLPCNIIVTQPRRIAAINIAKRVCQERGWGLGTVCGYQVGLDRVAEEKTILTYVTTEILLQKLIHQRSLNRYTHIIIDEVHERTTSLDFLLLLVRKYLLSDFGRVRIILMSATMDASEFAYYFRSQVHSQMEYYAAPIINVDKENAFTSHKYYFDHLLQFVTNIPDFEYSDPHISSETYKVCCLLIEYFKNLDGKDATTGQVVIGSVLVFLPGLFQIEEMDKYLQDFKPSIPWEIVPMHSSLPTDQLAAAFSRPKKGHRKIILATNIAESSITVPDVTYVIDFCLTKNMCVNSDTKFSSLNLEWASHNNCIQRAGRVGRVSNGRVYRMVPREFYKNQMKPNTVPEMQRAPLENIILYMKLLEINDTPKNVLSLALSPPKIKDIDTCIWHLKEIGALLQTCAGKRSMQDGDITFLGRVMGALPVDIHLTKLIVLGHMFGCLDETVIMAAGCMVQNLFMNPYKKKIEVYKKKLTWSDGSKSDLITLLNLYNVWQRLKREHHFRSVEMEYGWCRTNYVNYKGLKEWNLLINEIHTRLKRLHIENIPMSQCEGQRRNILSSVEKPTVLKVIICGAFYPNYFGRIKDRSQIDMREAVKDVNGQDPMHNVYFVNMKQHHPGPVYTRQIKKMLECENVTIGFDINVSSKIYVEFKPPQQKTQAINVGGMQRITALNNKIPEEIYIAIKKRKIGIPFTLKIMKDADAWKFYEESKSKLLPIENNSSEDLGCFGEISFSPLPSLDIQYLTLSLSTFVDAGLFYCQNADEGTQNLLMRISNLLNDPRTELKPLSKDKFELENKVYAARFKEDKLIYRCRVTRIIKQPLMQVLFIDYGNTDIVDITEIFEVPNEQILHLPNLAACCVLTGIQPSPIVCPNGIWSPEANKFVQKEISQVLLNAKVFSVVDDVISLELYNQRNSLKSINDLMVEKNFAIRCEESYRSKADNERRLHVQKSENPNYEAIRLKQTLPDRYIDFEEPDESHLAQTITLRGPYSPLEAKIVGLMRSTEAADITIEQSSINSVFLDDYPEDPHARLIVAGHIATNATQKRLILGQTTIMPNIAGFPMMMALTFCPTIDFKVNADGTVIGAILCGLGARDCSNRACYPEHDISLTLDTVLTKDIIIRINALRYAMNSALKIMTKIWEEIKHANEFVECQNQLKENLFNLLKVTKTSMEPVHVKYSNIWDKTERDDLEICKMKDQDEVNDIWPLLYFVYLKKESEKYSLCKKNIQELIEMAKNLIPIPNNVAKCEVCNKELYGIGYVRSHLVNPEHKKLVQELLGEH